MASSAFHAHGSTLEIYDGATFIPIVELSVIGMNFSSDEIDTTHHDSLDAWREYVRGLKTAEVILEGNFILSAPTHGFEEEYGLGHLFDSETLGILRIRFKDGDPLTFTAMLSEYTWVNDVEDAIRFSGRFKISGLVTAAQLFLIMWFEEFNYEPFEFGSFVSQYQETWSFGFETPISQYLETWDVNVSVGTSQYLETWDVNVSVGTSQYIETWES